VVIFSAYYWDSAIQVSAHHYGRIFSRNGWSVLFLSTPVTPFHALAVARSRDHRRRFRAWWKRGRVDRETGVTHYMPLTLLPLSSVIGLRYRWILRNWWKVTVPPLGPALERLGFAEPDLLIVDSPLGAFLVDLLRPRRSVMRVTDYNAGFASSTSELTAIERDLAGRVDVVAVTASELQRYAQSLAPGKSIMHLPHGVDLGRFSGPTHPPADMAGIAGPIVMYVGSLREWFDYELLGHLAVGLPQVSFVLIGPEFSARNRIGDRPNVHVLGERPYSMVHSYLTSADIGLIPFNRVDFPELVDHSNPLKLYEYMAAGLPVVSSDWPVMRRLDSPALLCRSSDDFLRAIPEALERARELSDAGLTFARTHGWDEAYDRLADLVPDAGGDGSSA
jgi:glycosyltransferase involved in cell wall biosynthesis